MLTEPKVVQNLTEPAAAASDDDNGGGDDGDSDDDDRDHDGAADDALLANTETCPSSETCCSDWTLTRVLWVSALTCPTSPG